jgi:MFS superfamily sulfate permease-like transporter
MAVKRILWDTSGAFGDIGLLIPISIALIVKNGFNPTALFLTAGLFYVLSARYFRITMPVQPLKAMSAVAIATGLGTEVINTAGITLGSILIVLALTGWSEKLGRIFPVPVVRGIQFGLGLMLARASLSLMSIDLVTALLAGAILIAHIAFMKKMPPLLIILLLGAVISLREIELTALGPMALEPALPDIGLLWISFTMLVVPQISLTMGNAVVATEATAKMLYKERAERVNLRSVPLSIGIANIASGLVGGVPMCHGSGGLTAHHKFGATSERSGYIIGMTLIVLALFFGTASLSVISAFPSGILGALLCYVGIQHAMLIKDIQKDQPAVLLALTVGVAGFLTHNLTVGFLIGLLIHYGSNIFRDSVAPFLSSKSRRTQYEG